MDFETFEKKYNDASSNPWVGQLGLYVISPKCPTGFHVDQRENCPVNRVPKNVKIGKATGQSGFRSRLKSYYTYWPQGLLVHGILTTPSLDRKFFTYKNHASDRERVLKQMLRKKKLIGFGPHNGSEKIGSEWVRATPSTIMPILESIAQGKDRLYGCNQGACVEKKIQNESNQVQTRSRKKVNEDKNKNGNQIGTPGRPRTRTRYMDKIIDNENHPLRPRVLAQIQEQNNLYNNAKNRLNQLKQREAIIEASPNSLQKETNMQKIQANICNLRGKIIKKYASYTHFDVTGDGRCYYYAVLKALGVPLHAGVGAPSNTLNSNKYFNTIAKRRKWKRSLDEGKYEDALFWILDSKEMRRILFHERNIRFIVRLHRTTRGHREIQNYIDDPVDHIRQTISSEVYYLTSTGLHASNAIKGSGRASRYDSINQFKKAFNDGNVISFVYRNIPGTQPHYEIILPHRLDPPHSPIRRRPKPLAEMNNTPNWKSAHMPTPNKVNATKSKRKKKPLFDRNAFLQPNHRIVADHMNNNAILYNRRTSNITNGTIPPNEPIR